jgi:hypothetical protein
MLVAYARQLQVHAVGCDRNQVTSSMMQTAKAMHLVPFLTPFLSHPCTRTLTTQMPQDPSQETATNTRGLERLPHEGVACSMGGA